MKKTRIFVLIVVLLFLVIQFIPVKRDNPPVAADMSDNEPVKAIFQKSCYDCHSNVTNWPWYSYVAPVSWLVAFDVHKGREYINFSDWSNLKPKQINYYKENIWYEINNNKMPIKPYLIIHPDAKISETERELIKTWATFQDTTVSSVSL